MVLHSDLVNVGYIINLLQMAVNSDNEDKRQQDEAQVHDLIGSDVSLHEKQGLIEKFIAENMPKMLNGENECSASIC